MALADATYVGRVDAAGEEGAKVEEAANDEAVELLGEAPAEGASEAAAPGALCPAAAQSPTLGQGTKSAGVPPGQKKPALQMTGAALVEPAGQPKPGGAEQ